MNDSGLICNLPFIKYKKDYLVFSPNRQSIIRFDESPLKIKGIKSFLVKNGYISDKDSYPRHITNLGFNITNDCNFRCLYCYAKAGANSNQMKLETAIGILNFFRKKVKKDNWFLISFSGGEPSLNMPVIHGVVNYLNTWNIKKHCHITTNGTLKDHSISFMIENAFDFTISLDGVKNVNELSRKSLRKQNTFGIIENNIEKLVRNKILFQIRTTITDLNLDYLPSLIEYCSDMGVEFIHLEPISLDGFAEVNRMQLPNKSKFLDIWFKIVDIAESRNIKIISSSYMNLLTPSTYFCSSINGNKYIFNSDGSLSLCYKVQSNEDSPKDFIIGHYDKFNGGIKINHKDRKELRVISNTYDKNCETCFAKYICAGGCPHRNYLSNNSFIKPDEWTCEIRKKIIRDALVRLYNNPENNSILGSYLYEQSVLFN